MSKLSGTSKSSPLTDMQCFVAVLERLKGKAAESFVLGLINKGLVQEVRAKAAMPVWRRDGESGKAYALKITACGRKALPVEPSAPNPIAISAEKTPGAAKGRERKGQPEHSPRAGAKEKIHAHRAQHDDAGRAKNEPLKAEAPRPGSKLAKVITLLLRDQGTGIEELTVATGWLPHTTRAALTGLHKRGYILLRERPEGKATTYRILTVPQSQAV